MNSLKSLGLSVLFGLLFGNLAVAEQHSPISGVLFAELADEGSVRVSLIETGTQTELIVGDILQTYIPTGESIGSISKLFEIVNREQALGTDLFIFSVARDDFIWVTTVTLP